jgi:hypothetical protein
MKIEKWSGKPITKPGWYSGIPIEKYHSRGICAGPAVSSSDLRTCWSKSPAHMYARWAENPDREEKPSTRQMILGSAAHHLFLGEENYNKRFVMQPDKYRDKVTAEEKPWHNGAAVCKKWNADMEAKGLTIVVPKELDAIKKMAASLTVDPMVQNGILSGNVECSGFWKDQETGLWVKVRPDVIPMSDGDYVDLKTAADVTTPALQYSIRSYGYHMQGALVWEAADVLRPDAVFATFVLLFIETANPYCARSVPVHKDDLSRGRLQNRMMMQQIALCMVENRWPGPGDDDHRELPMANDERTRIDARLKAGGLLP